jgi:hypothetical protein
VRILGSDLQTTPVVITSQPFHVQMDVDLERVPEGLTVGFDLTLADGTVVFRSYQTDGSPDRWPSLSPGRNRLECEVAADLLNTGRYTVNPRVSIDRVRWIVHGGSVSFEVHRDPGDSLNALVDKPGAIAPVLVWRRAEGAT